MEKKTNLLTTQVFSDNDNVVSVPAAMATNGEKIKALRMAEGMRRSDLAERISLSDRSIRFIENGERNPSEYTLKKVATVFGVTMDYFADPTISKKELEDPRSFEKVYKKYEINSDMQVDEIMKKLTEMVNRGELTADKQVEFVEFAKRIEDQKK